ncbi:hypothetical protein WR25_13950 isoform C [Diploscapter pachys]|uniref:Amine oxidase n=1 Tax=Diploscapter pachys TaxID=2018661 RepID=A0A2A2J8T2_9BILA|nr:hypothetical protein WR25_13950 isoform C [Diploscapter pachys]
MPFQGFGMDLRLTVVGLFFHFLHLFHLFPAVFPQTSFPISRENREGQVYDVIIVGAGLTGLTAARQLRATHPRASVIILEARGTVGGRIRAKSMTTATGDVWIDYGAQFISPNHKEIINLAKEVNLEFFPQANCGERATYFERKKQRAKRAINWSQNLSTRPTFAELVQSPDSLPLANQTVNQFVQSSIQTQPDADAINRLLQTFYDAPSETISALQLPITTSSDNTTVAELLRNLGHGKGMLLDKGMFQLTQQLADGMHIRYSEPVLEINELANPVQVRTTQAVYSAKQVIVTAPLVTLPNIRFNPPLNQSFANLIDSYKPTGFAYYFVMTYEIAFWRNQGKSGQVIFTSDNGPIAWLTTFDMGYGPGCGQIRGQTGILWGIAHFNYNLSEDGRHNQYVQIIAKIMQNTDFAPLDVSDSQLSADPFARGSVGVFKPGFDIGLLEFLKGYYTNSQQNVYFASSELSNTSTGMMNGAVISGKLVADAVSEKLAATKFENALQKDIPISGEQHFVYHTSTHYPPGIVSDETESSTPHSYPLQASTPFVYQTSSHYSPDIIDGTRDNQQNDPINQNDNPVTPFPYHTSSHYPKLANLETSTFDHFSFGNRKTPSSSPNMESHDAEFDNSGYGEIDQTLRILNNDQRPRSPGTEPSTMSPESAANFQFHYETSSVNPKIENLETSTMHHFSFGNLGDNSGTRLHFDSAPSSSQASSNGNSFHYETSTHYPPSSDPTRNDQFYHFSMGNIEDPLPTSVITQHVYRTPVQPSENNNDNVGEELKKLADEVVFFLQFLG